MHRLLIKKNIIVVAVLLLTVMNALYWATQKEGFYGDEMYSYAFVCSPDFPSVNDDRPDEPYYNNWHNGTFYNDYFVIDDEEAYDIVGVLKVIWGDNHPPIFDLCLEFIISSFSRNTFTKWTGIVINIVFYLATIIVMYLLCKELFGSFIYAILATAFYGFSIGAVSNFVFIRMYLMATFACLLYAYVSYLIRQQIIGSEESKKWLYYLLSLSIVFGMTVQYYFSIFCFFMTLFTFMSICNTRKWKEISVYVLYVCGGLIVSGIIWPATYREIFFGDRAIEAYRNISETNTFFSRLSENLVIINNECFGKIGWLLAVCSIIVLIILIVSKIKGKRDEINMDIYRVVLSALCYLLLVSKISPMVVDRYIFCVFPFSAILLLYWFRKLELVLNKYAVWLVLALLVLISISGYKNVGVNYIYKGDLKKVSVMQQQAETATFLIACNTRRYYSCVNSYYLRNVNRIFPTIVDYKDEFTEEIKSCIDTDRKAIVFLDKSYWDNDSLLNAIEEAAYITRTSFLFETEESNVYLLEKTDE